MFIPGAIEGALNMKVPNAAYDRTKTKKVVVVSGIAQSN
jgi:hypothetical protein